MPGCTAGTARTRRARRWRRIGRPVAAQPGRKLSRTVRVALSAFGSSRQIDCHVPSAEPPADDRHGQRRRRQQRQDVVGAVAGRSVAMAVQPLLARQEAVERGEQVVVRAGPDLDDDQPGGRVRARRPTAGRRPVGRLGRERRRTPPVRSTSPRTDPVRTVSSRVSTGRCSGGRRAAGRGRRRPAPTRSAAARPRRGCAAPHWSRPTAVL